MRVWDRNSGQEIKRLDFPAIPSSMEVSKDGSIITTTHSNIVTFWNSKEYVYFFLYYTNNILNCSLSLSIVIGTIIKIRYIFTYENIIFLIFKFPIRLTKIKEFAVPTQVNSASLHPDCNMFVCGGEDFKMYKFDYNTGAELGEICHVYINYINITILINKMINIIVYNFCF